MGIIIKPGTGEIAHQELWGFTNAYPTIYLGTNADGNEEYVLFDASDVEMFDDMTENQLIGTFSIM